MYELKLKWASCYVPPIFTAGVHTTSRAESINAVIKNYVNSNSEISDIFDFIIAFEQKLLMKTKMDEEKKKVEIHPLLQELRVKLSEYIFDLHCEQFILCSRYRINAVDITAMNLQTSTPHFRVYSIDSKDKNKYREVKLFPTGYYCECSTFIQCGIICRYIFYVSCLRQEKSLATTGLCIHPRWLIKSEYIELSIEELLKDFVTKKKQKIDSNDRTKEEKKEETTEIRKFINLSNILIY